MGVNLLTLVKYHPLLKILLNFFKRQLMRGSLTGAVAS